MAGLNVHVAACDYMSFIHYGICVRCGVEERGWASPRGMPWVSPQSLEYYHPLVVGKGDSPCE